MVEVWRNKAYCQSVNVFIFKNRGLAACGPEQYLLQVSQHTTMTDLQQMLVEEPGGLVSRLPTYQGQWIKSGLLEALCWMKDLPDLSHYLCDMCFEC